MKRISLVIATLLVWLLPASASAQGGNSSVQAFGGLTFGTSDVIGSSSSSNVGAAVSVGLTPNVQIVGEGGRMADISPGFYDLLDFTPFNVGVSAWYAQGGVRLIAGPGAAVRPYGEATAGLARLRPTVSGLGGLPGSAVDTALGFMERTEPMFGVGAGVVLGAGPLALDVGYRYRQIRASGVSSLLNAGNSFGVNELRLGVGVSF